MSEVQIFNRVRVLELTGTGGQGPAGLNWDNAGWIVNETYWVNAALEHDGSSFRALVEHEATAATEPGVGADWRDVWEILAAKGEQGEQGIQGVQGGKGEQGDQGEQGIPGDLTPEFSSAVDQVEADRIRVEELAQDVEGVGIVVENLDAILAVPRLVSEAEQAVVDAQAQAVLAQTAATSALANGGLIYGTEALLKADLAHGPNTAAWVISDPDPTRRGIYTKSGASGTGAWSKSAELPYGFVRAETRSHALALGQSGSTGILIMYDEANQYRSTLNMFDGWDLHLMSILPWTPQVFFAGGRRGFIYDPSDVSTLYQDRAFALPAVNNNDPIAVVLDKHVRRPGLGIRKNLRYSTDDPAYNGTSISGLVTPRIQQGVRSPINTPVFKAMDTAPLALHGQIVTFAHAGGNLCYWRLFKAAEWSKVRLQFTTAIHTTFDLAAGTVITNTGGSNGSIVSLGDGWYQVAIAINGVAGPSYSIGYHVLDDSGALTRTGDVAKGVLISSEQLELSSSPTSYQPVGSNVGGWVGGNVLSNVSDSQRPRLIEDGFTKAIRTDGVDDFLFAEGVDLTSTEAVTTIAMAIKHTSAAGLNVPLTHGHANFTTTSTSERAFLLDASAGSFAAVAGANGGYRSVLMSDVLPSDVPYVAVVTFDPLNANINDRIIIWINGVRVAAASNGAVGSLIAEAASAVGRLSVGMRDALSVPSAADFYYLLGVNRALTSDELARLTQYMGQKAGIAIGGVPGPLDFTQVPASGQFVDTVTPVESGGYYKTSPFAQLVYDTEATSLQINVVNDIAVNFPLLIDVSIYINDVFYTFIKPAVNGETSHMVSLPAGLKRIRVVNGTQSKLTTVRGVWVKSILSDAVLTPVAVPPRNVRYLFYGDSITAGDSSRPAGRFGYPVQVRKSAQAASPARSVQVEAYGSRTLWDDCKDATARAAFVAKIVAINPTVFWSAMGGTNDHGLAPWSAANFGTAYAALLDDLHTALPSLVIYAQTAIPRSTDGTANSFGNTLENYREQIRTAASSRSAFVTLVEGSAWTTIVLSDGTHPSGVGHTTYANNVKAVLGLA